MLPEGSVKNYSAIAHRYAEAVVAGDISACAWIKLACQRQLSDLARKKWRWRFSSGHANQICAFAEHLPHVVGRWNTKTIVLEPWQCFLLTTIFGWVDGDGLRRFRKALTVTPRKNAKTTIAAIVGLFLMIMDDEPGAEIYWAAVARAQARFGWNTARRMVQKTTLMREHYGLDPQSHSITMEGRGSFFRPLSRDVDTLEGLNPHGAIIDELHAHKTREVFDVLDDATGSRRQPLMFIISTEGDDNEGIFAEQMNYAKAVLAGHHIDDSYFAVIYTIDAEDDWTQESVWYKANPNLGVSLFLEDMQLRYKQALANPHSQSSFLTKRLNVRVGASAAYFNVLSWQQLCKDESVKLEAFRGQPCVITLDLASKRDLTTLIIVFRKGARLYVFGRYYLPEAAIDPAKPNHALYEGWQREGRLVVTPGDITDYEFLEQDLKELVVTFRPSRVGVDPNYNAGQFTTRMLSAGVPMIDTPHTVPQFSEPMKELEARIIAGTIRHDGDPVLGWAIANVVAKEDAKGNVYPRKSSAEAKIDPAVALIANIGQQLRLSPASVYATNPSM